MNEPTTRIEQTTVRQGDTVQTTRDIAQPKHAAGHRSTVASRVVWFIAGVIITLLAFRFVFVLLGANQANAFANFIFTISHPFASPFFGLFNYSQQYGTASIEFSTLVAIAVYALVAFGISKLVQIGKE